jgi:hypothetical protein
MAPLIVKHGPSGPPEHDDSTMAMNAAMAKNLFLGFKFFMIVKNVGAKIVKMWKIVYLCENYK